MKFRGDVSDQFHVGQVIGQTVGDQYVKCVAVEYNPDTEIGRHVLFNRVTPPGAKQPVEYIIDPAYWVDTVQQIRTDIKGFPISWYIGVHPMAKTAAKTDK